MLKIFLTAYFPLSRLGKTKLFRQNENDWIAVVGVDTVNCPSSVGCWYYLCGTVRGLSFYLLLCLTLTESQGPERTRTQQPNMTHKCLLCCESQLELITNLDPGFHYPTKEPRYLKQVQNIWCPDCCIVGKKKKCMSFRMGRTPELYW